jgi:hypothetical protein
MRPERRALCLWTPRLFVLFALLLLPGLAHADEPTAQPAQPSSSTKTIATVAFVGGGVLVAAGIITTMAAFGSSHCDLSMQPCEKKGAETGAAVGITFMAVGVLAIAALGIPLTIAADKKTQVSITPGGLSATF